MKRITLQMASLLSMFAFTVNAQKIEKPLVADYLKGNYKAECLTELVDQGAFLRKCEFCTLGFDEKAQEYFVKNIEISFTADSLTINQYGKLTTVKYNGSKETNSFSFFYDKKYYNFKVFAYKEQFILEEDNGLLTVLTKLN